MMDIERHPCFSDRAHGRHGRMHIPCAPKCNFNCAYCGRGKDDGQTQLPGRTIEIVRPAQTEEYVSQRLERHPEITVLAIAGPGEPLFNPETFKTLEILKAKFPAYPKCLGTNGYFLSENVSRLKDLGVETVTVTLNSLRPETNAQINDRIIGDGGRILEGISAGESIVKRQTEGIARAVGAGMVVKINTVLVPGINDGEMGEIAQKAKTLGAYIMNIMPLKPAGRFCHLPSPMPGEIHAARAMAEVYMPQFRTCSQCRADACGIPSAAEDGGFCYK